MPLLDHELVEWIAGLSPDLKLKSGEGKFVFKRALQRTLPDNILYRPKMGFAVPLGSWFKGPLSEVARESILSTEMLDSGVFKRETLSRILSQHSAGARDFSAIIWTLLMFGEFMRGDVAVS